MRVSGATADPLNQRSDVLLGVAQMFPAARTAELWKRSVDDMRLIGARWMTRSSVRQAVRTAAGESSCDNLYVAMVTFRRGYNYCLL